ncbi:class I SAM-dependent methyltransferase [Desulfogranum japonicum]|uniref:class I SAM-dependent methyltransferase n=1 Tax=Desulfogranum japonicum TaxID=231447 RepID=UPI0004157D65|nr:class I SAM-dependent methyltransferase [Desulfogranum japonicum]
MKTILRSARVPYPSMAPIFDLLAAPVKLAVLEAAIELNITEILTDNSELDEIAKQLDIKGEKSALMYFLDGVVALGLAEKKERRYFNTDFGKDFFHKESPVYMGSLLKNMKGMQHKNLPKIAEIITQGPPEVPPEQVLNSEAKWVEAVEHLAAYQRGGMGAICADLVEELPEFAGVKKILDLGGGPGIIGTEILKRKPGAVGVLLDLPAIITLAEKEIKKEGLADRVSLLAGDYNQIDLGNGYDLIWASHNLYYVKDRVSFFTRLKNALSDKGVFVCLHEGLTCEQTAPANIVLSRLSLALEGQNVSFSKGEIAEDLQSVGFSWVDSKMLNLPAGQAELVVARP